MTGKPPEGPDEVGRADTAISGNFPAHKPAAARPAEGARLGRYRIDRPLGQGGMASVYLATEDGSGRRVALKVMNGALSEDPGFVLRFQQEAKAMASLRHPNVVGVFDAGRADGHFFMATEFIDGGTVGGLLSRMREVPAAVAAEVVAQVLTGLVHAHAHGVVHRDLKPENLLLTSTGTVKVADFGIARTTGGGAGLTSTGMLIGTAGYMSPEQARGTRVDDRSDLYAIGIILYELLTGTNPYASDNPATSLTRIMANAALPIIAVRPAVPATLELVLDRLLQLDVKDRFPSAQAALDVLLPFIEERRRTQPNLLAECLQRPAELKQLLDTQTADLLVGEARPHLDGDAVTRTRAVLKLHQALLHDAHYAEAKRLLQELSLKQLLYFGPTRNPKLAELEQVIAAQPDLAPALQMAAQLARLEGNPLKASVFLKRYLRVRPEDAYVAQQLAQLTGERALAPRPPNTAEIVAGIKKGGFAAVSGVRRAPTQQVPAGPSLPPAELLDMAPADVRNPLPDLIGKILILVAVLGTLVIGYRKLSRSIDEEATAVMHEEQAWKDAEKRARAITGTLDGGP